MRHARKPGGRTLAVRIGPAVRSALKPRGWLLVAAGIVLALSFDSPARAADVVGSVTDVSGQPVVNATVVVLNAQGKQVASGVTNASGLYSVNGLPTGDYTVKLAGVSGGSAMASNSAEVDTALPVQGETINWTMANNGSAIATQQIGIPGNNLEEFITTGVNGATAPYGAGLTEMGAGANNGPRDLGTTTTTTNSFASSSALPAISNNSGGTPATPKPASPSS